MKYLITLAATCSLAASQVAYPTSAPGSYPSCFICGDGQVVTKRDHEIQLADTEPLQCGFLADAASNGQLAPADCSELPTLVSDTCGCTLTPLPGTFPYCHVCGEGKEITEHDVSLTFPGHQPWTCAQIDLAGENGQIEDLGCLALPTLISDYCGCKEIQSESTVPPIGSSPKCDVCGYGRRVTKESTSIIFAEHGSFTCEQIEDAGHFGLIEPAYCAGMPAIIDVACGCSADSSASSEQVVVTPEIDPTTAPYSFVRNTPSPNPVPTVVAQVPTSFPTTFLGSTPELNTKYTTGTTSPPRDTLALGGIIGIVFGVAAGVALLTITIILTRRRKESRTTSPGDMESSDFVIGKSQHNPII